MRKLGHKCAQPVTLRADKRLIVPGLHWIGWGGRSALKSYEKVCGRPPDTTLSPFVEGGFNSGVDRSLRVGRLLTPYLVPTTDPAAEHEAAGN